MDLMECMLLIHRIRMLHHEQYTSFEKHYEASKHADTTLSMAAGLGSVPSCGYLNKIVQLCRTVCSVQHRKCQAKCETMLLASLLRSQTTTRADQSSCDSLCQPRTYNTQPF